MGASEALSSNIDGAEVARFGGQAEAWWNPEGVAKPLHRINPLRLAFIRDRLAAHFGRDPKALHPFAGLHLLDIGCGAGLIAEPMARLGFGVTGIDAGEAMLAAARDHAAAGGLAIDYRAGTAESLAERGETFDAVLALEVAEHVENPATFLRAAAQLVRPGGALIASTLNRTLKSYLLGIVAAEHVLGWVPRGTHRWERFLRPSEVAAALRSEGLTTVALEGLSYNIASNTWHRSSDFDVNYLLLAVKNAASG